LGIGFCYFAMKAGWLLIFLRSKGFRKMMKPSDGSKQKLAEVYDTQGMIASSI